MTTRILFTLIAFLVFSPVQGVEARRGCCSHHRGVCGCRCCDGTSLSSKCAPYYPSCKPKPAPKPKPKPKAKVPLKTKSTNSSLKEGQRAYVEKVSDGDTLKVRLLSGSKETVTIRLLGIDCPESHKNSKCAKDGREGRLTCSQQIPLGMKASQRAAQLLKYKVVTLETGTNDGHFKKGGYGRWLAYVRMEDGRDFGLVMIQEGLCEDFGWKYPHPRGVQYKASKR